MRKKILDAALLLAFALCLIVTSNIQEEAAYVAELEIEVVPLQDQEAEPEEMQFSAGVAAAISANSFTTESDEETGVEKKDVIRGQVLAAPGSIHPHTKFEAQIYVLSKEEGGRHSPFFTGYRPQFYFRTTDITGTVELEPGTDMVKPGDNVMIIGELIHPIAMDEGLKLAIREGGRTIASGQVTKIIE